MNYRNRIQLLPLLTAALCFVACSCGGPQEHANTARQAAVPSNSNLTVSNTRSPSANVSGNQTTTAVGSTGFLTEEVCTLPQEVSKDSPFAGLGGGNWEKWDEAGGGGLNYSCAGGRDSIKLEDVTAKISGRYSALGDEQSVQVVSATYIALQYGGKTPVEGPLRQKFVEFCDGLARKLYGQPMPDKFRSRLTDESTYSESESPEKYVEKLERGMVTVSARTEKSGLLRLEVNFFPDEAAYKKFKES